MSARALATAFAVCVATAAAVPVARAQNEDYFRGKPDEVVFRVDKERSTNDKIVIGSIGGGAILFGAIGTAFSLDYRSKSDEVSAAGIHTGKVYTDAVEDTRKSALRSRNLAIVSYSIAGAALIGTIVAYVVTDPGTEVFTYGPGGVIQKRAESATLIAPVEGGAIVGKTWSF